MINIASIDGISVNPQETYSYHASKAGLIHLTKRMALRLTAGRIGDAEDMAAAAVYLASRAGDYVVGAMITLDGRVSFSR